MPAFRLSLSKLESAARYIGEVGLGDEVLLDGARQNVTHIGMICVQDEQLPIRCERKPLTMTVPQSLDVALTGLS